MSFGEEKNVQIELESGIAGLFFRQKMGESKACVIPGPLEVSLCEQWERRGRSSSTPFLSSVCRVPPVCPVLYRS